MNKNITKRHELFKDTIRLNNDTYFDYLDRFKRYALSMFKWENLPTSMNERYLELCLYYLGRSAFIYDKNLGFLNTKVTGSSSINIYGLPNKLNCYSYSYNTMRDTYMGYDELDKSNEKAILVMNNYDMIPTALSIELFAYRMAIIQRTLDLNIKQQKFPYILSTDNKTRYSINQMINQIDMNEISLVVEKDIITPETIKVLNLKVPFIADKLADAKKEVLNEFLTFMGINNIDYKKERLIESEGDNKNESVNYNLQAMLIPRQEACKQFNEYFKPEKPISVKIRSDIHNIIKDFESVFSADLNNNGVIDKKIKQEDHDV